MCLYFSIRQVHDARHIAVGRWYILEGNNVEENEKIKPIILPAVEICLAGDSVTKTLFFVKVLRTFLGVAMCNLEIKATFRVIAFRPSSL